MLIFCQDIERVLKHNLFNLARKITVFIKFSNNAKKTKIVNRKMLLPRLSGSGFKVHGLATPTSQFKGSYKEISNTYQFSQWMIIADSCKHTAMSCN
jgi:hypothetical protein